MNRTVSAVIAMPTRLVGMSVEVTPPHSLSKLDYIRTTGISDQHVV